jgi:hypothetical protein
MKTAPIIAAVGESPNLTNAEHSSSASRARWYDEANSSPVSLASKAAFYAGFPVVSVEEGLLCAESKRGIARKSAGLDLKGSKFI